MGCACSRILILLFVCLQFVVCTRQLTGTERLLVVDETYGLVWVIDPLTGTSLSGITLPGAPLGNTLPRGDSGIAYDGTELFYTSRATGLIWVLDVLSGQVLRTLPKPSADISALDARDGELFAVTSPRAPVAD